MISSAAMELWGIKTALRFTFNVSRFILSETKLVSLPWLMFRQNINMF